MLYFHTESNPPKVTESEIGLASVPAMAIGSSTEVLVSIVENQAKLRRSSFLTKNQEHKSPDFDVGKSPSTEMTYSSNQSANSMVESDVEVVKSPSTDLSALQTPNEEFTELDTNDNEKVCDNLLVSDSIDQLNDANV